MAVADELIALLGYELTGEENARRYESTLSNLTKKAVQFGKVVGTAMVGASVLFAKSVVSTSAQFESYLATLETIEGSAEKAKSAMDWVSNFAKTTPYEVSQVTEAFVRLKAYGIDPLAENTMKVLGDTASAMGKPLMQAVEALADAQTGEFERLKEFGLKAKQKGDEVTFSWTQNGKELTKTVKKNATEIRGFILDTLGNRFSGAMDKQSKTWNGMVSNLADSWTDFKRRVGDYLFFGDLKANLQRVLDTIARLDADGTLDEWALNLSSALSTALYGVELFVERLIRHGSFIYQNIQDWESLGIALGIVVAWFMPAAAAALLLLLALDDLMTFFEGGDSKIGQWTQKFIADLQSGIDEIKALVNSWLDWMEEKFSFMGDLNPFKGVRLSESLKDIKYKSEKANQDAPGAIDRMLDGMDPSRHDARAAQSMHMEVGPSSRRGYRRAETSFEVQLEETLQQLLRNAEVKDDQGGAINKMLAGMDNLSANLSKMAGDAAATKIDQNVTDARQDNRQFPVTVSAPVTVNVTQAAQAPAAVGNAVGNAVKSAAQQRSQVESSPASFD